MVLVCRGCPDGSFGLGVFGRCSLGRGKRLVRWVLSPGDTDVAPEVFMVGGAHRGFYSDSLEGDVDRFPGDCEFGDTKK